MNLTPALEKQYTKEQKTALEAQRLAQEIAFGPVVFQISQLMVKFGVLEALCNAPKGLTMAEVAAQTKLSDYAVKILLEASLSIGTVIVSNDDRFSITKAGWFLLRDKTTRVNMEFIQEVCYEGLFHLEEALTEGKPIWLLVYYLRGTFTTAP